MFRHGGKLCFVVLALFASVGLQAAERITLQLKWSHAFQFAGYYAALAQGYYAEAGLEVSLSEARPGIDPIDELLSGRADYAVGNSSALIARQQGKPLVVLATIFQHSPSGLVALRRPGLGSVHDLADKRLMLEPMSEEIDAYLRRAGIPLERIQRVPHEHSLDALRERRVEAMSVYSTNETYHLEQSGLDYLMFSPRSVGIDFYGDNLLTTLNELRQHPQRVAAFRAASLRGWEYALQHPEEMIALIRSKYAPQLGSEFLRYEAARTAELIHADLVPIGYMHPGRWQHIAEVYAELGMLPADVALDDFLYSTEAKAGLPRWVHAVLLLTLLVVFAIAAVAWHIHRINQRLRQGHAELQKAHQQLRLFLTAAEQGPMSILITDADSVIRYVNPFLTNITGYTAGEVIGQTPRMFRSGLTPVDTYRDMWGTLRSGQPWAGELQNRRKNGELYWEETHIAPVRDDDGTVTHYIGLKRDITRRREAEQLLAASEARLRTIFSNLPCMVYQLLLRPDGDVRFTFVSEGVSLFGLSPAQVTGDAASLMGLIHPDDQARVMQSSLEAAAAMRDWHAEFRLCHPDGRLIWVEARDQPIGQEGEAVLCTGYLIDITARRELEDRLRSSEEKFRTFVENANDIIYTVTLDGVIDYVSPNWSEILGHPLDSIIGRGYSDMVHPEDLAACEAFFARLIETRRKQSGVEYRVRHADGHWCWHISNAAPRFDAAGNVCGVLGIARDISERKAAELHMTHLAHHDPLTGLPNRILFSDRVRQALLVAQRSGEHLALMFIDLDRFKPINDTHGHHVGDLVLQEVARRISSTVRAADTVARVGGDEFVVLLTGLDDAPAAVNVAAKIHTALRQPFEYGELSLHLSSCIGISLSPEHGSTEQELAAHADSAMYEAKQAGRDGIRLYAAPEV